MKTTHTNKLNSEFKKIILDAVKKRRGAKATPPPKLLTCALYLQEYLDTGKTNDLIITDLRKASINIKNSLRPSLIVIKNKSGLVTILYTIKKGSLHRKFLVESGSKNNYKCATLMKKIKKETGSCDKSFVNNCDFIALTPKTGNNLNHKNLHLLKYAALKYYDNVFDVNLDESYEDCVNAANAKK